jgi:hypothetical protein
VLQERIVHQIDLSDRKVVGGPPISVHLAKLLGGEGAGGLFDHVMTTSFAISFSAGVSGMGCDAGIYYVLPIVVSNSTLLPVSTHTATDAHHHDYKNDSYDDRTKR